MESKICLDSEREVAILGLSKSINLSLKIVCWHFEFCFNCNGNSNAAVLPLYDLMKQTNEFIWGIEKEGNLNK